VSFVHGLAAAARVSQADACEEAPMFRLDQTVRDLSAAVAVLLLTTFGYFVLPLAEFGAIGSWAFVAAFLVGLVAVGLLIIRQVRRYRRRPQGRSAPIAGLVASLYLAVLFFAAVYYSLAKQQPLAIPSLRTKLDALYFAWTITSTTGFGDIHAASQIARAIVTINLAFNVGFLGVAVTIVRTTSRSRR
jgi:voltage-gated potassium channel